MIRNLIRSSGLYVHLKYLRKKFFPSATQQLEKKLIPARLSFYNQFVNVGDICFDVGANIGNRTEIFLALGAKVIAVEPQRQCVQMLKLRFGNKIHLLQVALGMSEASAKMYISETSEISSLSKDWIDSVSKSRFSNSQWTKKETVRISTLDRLIATYGLPRFCKIDVEGYEQEVLMGLSQPIEFISFEYTIPERMGSVAECLAQLSKLGNFECNYTVGEQMELKFPQWVSQETLMKTLIQISNEELFGDVYIHFISIP